MAETMTIGVVGLGDIGGNLARWLVKRRQHVIGFDTADDARSRARDAGVEIAATRAELAAASQFVVTSLAEIAAIEETYLAADGLVALQHEGLVTLECSTVPTELARRLTAARRRAGGAAIEASVIGTGKEARAGALYFLVSGDAADIARAKPMLEMAGRGWQTMGGSGTASIAKLLNNGVGAATICAIAEALALAARHGIEPRALVEAMLEGAGAGRSVVLERHGRFMAGEQPARRFNPIALKDSQGLAALLQAAGRDALPVLSRTIDSYAHELPPSPVAAPERLAQAALARLEETSQ